MRAELDSAHKRGRAIAYTAVHIPIGGGRLLLPDATEVKDLISFEKAVATLGSQPEVIREALVAMFAPFAREHPKPLVRTAVEIVTGSSDGKLRIAMLGAAMAGEIDVLVKSPHGNVAHQVAPQVWREPDAQVANPATMVATGKFLVMRELLPHLALEVRLGGADLYLRASQFRKLIGAGSGSLAAQLRAAREILHAFLEEHPGDRLTIPEHLEPMRKRFPGASRAPLVRAIREVRPKEWGKGGRPRGRRS